MRAEQEAEVALPQDGEAVGQARDRPRLAATGSSNLRAMAVPWKVVGLAGLAGVAATGVVLARKKRTHEEYDPDELRDKLRSRLADAPDDNGGAAAETPAET